MVTYAYTILYVKDVEKTVRFYVNAFDFVKKFITPESDYGEIISGTTTIAFASTALANDNLSDGFILSNLSEKPFGIELAFATEEPEKTIEKALNVGATLIVPITKKPWGQHVAYIRDINGFLLEICTPMNPQ